MVRLWTELGWRRPNWHSKGLKCQDKYPPHDPQGGPRHLLMYCSTTDKMSTVPLWDQLTTHKLCYLSRLQSRKQLAEHVYLKLNKTGKKVSFKFLTPERQFSQESNNQFVVYRRQHFKEKQKPDLKGKKKKQCYTKTASLKTSDMQSLKDF